MIANENAYRSSLVTTQTRRESHRAVDKRKLYNVIIDELKNKQMTARQIGVSAYNKGLVLSPTRQQIQPRLTELVAQERIEVCGKQHDKLTGRNVAIYRLVDEHE